MRANAIGLLLTCGLAVLVLGCAAPSGGPALTVGATSDPQGSLLANIYAAGLRYYGTDAGVAFSADPFAELDAGAVTVVPGMTGRLLARFDPDTDARSAVQVYRAMVGALPEGVAAADYAVAAQDKSALAVTEATATRWGGRGLEALVDHCAGISDGALAGGTPPAAVGMCTMGPLRRFPDAAALFGALNTGSITAAWTTTADIAVPDMVVVLIDGKPALVPANNAVALYRRNGLDQMQLRAINEIAGVLDTASLVEMTRQVAAGDDPRTVAEAWLAQNPLGR